MTSMMSSLKSAAAAINLSKITCTFASLAKPVARPGDRPGVGAGDYTAVCEASLTVARGEFVSVVGPTGCGKSTLLNIAAGLIAPTAGEVTVFGTPLKGINRHAGYLFQSDALLPWMSAVDNVIVGLIFRGIRRADALERGHQWLARVGLSGHGHKYPHQLSGGMKKRLSPAQVLINDPDILLMDEPFSALDIQTRQLMENELLDLWSADRKSVLFITHDLEEAISLSDRVVVLSAGPETRPIGEFAIALPRPRDVAEVRMTPGFLELHKQIWDILKAEVQKGYRQGLAA